MMLSKLHTYLLRKFSLLPVFILFTSYVLFAQPVNKQNNSPIMGNKIDLSGTWLYQLDSSDRGVTESWYNNKLPGKLQLPGSLTTNHMGPEITTTTPWTGQIIDSSYFLKPEYEKYRRAGNIKVPFWLQPVKYYKGAAWYQKDVIIPNGWKGRDVSLFIERSHWETRVWIDNNEVGLRNSLSTPHQFDVGKYLTPGTHRVTIRIDNRVKDFNVGQNSHSISDHTQSNWNGMIGNLQLIARSNVYIDEVQLFPDIEKKEVNVRIMINNKTSGSRGVQIQLIAKSSSKNAEGLKPLSKVVQLSQGENIINLTYPMGSRPLLWDEFQPNLYSMKVQVSGSNEKDEKHASFGMREFAIKGTQFSINGRPTFLRGTLECAIFPKTGYPPTDVASWVRIFKVAKSYGLNHMRFHSWCPPEAAFIAADQSGFYLQVEAASWANQGATIGDGNPLDKYIFEESERIVSAYGNHPSFSMFSYGNEPAGKNQVQYLARFVEYWKNKDSRRLYTSGAGWPVIPENDYNSSPDPRIQGWGQELKSIINSKPPKSDYDWSEIIGKWKVPTVSHEIGQWCVYPDFKEIKQYTGVLKARNFEIFRDRLNDNGLGNLADSFLLASGKLQVLCYKADIEAALRTPGFGGFQLLDLHDFPGQGTALVGVLNPFWEEKGYITAKEYSRFCNAVVPLVRLPKMIYQNNEELSVPVEVAQFSNVDLKAITPSWNIKDATGKAVFSGQLAKANIPVGNAIMIGEINQSLRSITKASKLVLTVVVGNYQNSWDLFVYPATLPTVEDNILVTQVIDDAAIKMLHNGGKVLLTLKKAALKPEMGGDIKIGFSSIFWNTAWTLGQAPNTLGILCDPTHPAFSDFPTEYHSNWQWWDAFRHSNAIRLDTVANGLRPIVRVIDDWVTAQSLGLVFECKVGNGKLVVSGIDLLSDSDNRIEARQLLYSLKRYMSSNKFQPVSQVNIESIIGLTR